MSQPTPQEQSRNPTRFSESKVKNISIYDIYWSYNTKTAQAVRDFFNGKDIHCVSCYEALDLKTAELTTTVNNKWSLSLSQADGSIIHAAPYFKCPCAYENSFLKLLQQAI